MKRRWRSHRWNERGEGEVAAIIFFAIIGLAIYGGIQLFHSSAFGFWWQRQHLRDLDRVYSVEADGVSYISCGGAPSISRSGGWLSQADTFEVAFLNNEGLGIRLSGVRKVVSTQIPSRLGDLCAAPNKTYLGY